MILTILTFLKDLVIWCPFIHHINLFHVSVEEVLLLTAYYIFSIGFKAWIMTKSMLKAIKLNYVWKQLAPVSGLTLSFLGSILSFMFQATPLVVRLAKPPLNFPALLRGGSPELLSHQALLIITVPKLLNALRILSVPGWVGWQQQLSCARLCQQYNNYKAFNGPVVSYDLVNYCKR